MYQLVALSEPVLEVMAALNLEIAMVLDFPDTRESFARKYT